LYTRRKEIFSEPKSSVAGSAPLLAVGSILYPIGMWQESALSRNDYLSLMTCSAVVLWAGSFFAVMGTRALRFAAFPLLFLLFAVPIPTVALDRIVLFLQKWSTEASYLFFKVIGVPIDREGFVFHMPGLSVEVAKQCSGIRSSLVLFIMGVLIGGIFLKTMSRRVVFMLFVVPVAVVKNGIRIVTLSLLGIYVDPKFVIDSPLHRSGGILFFLLALSLLMPVLWVLRKSEKGMKELGTSRAGDRQ
jgi:exosortase